MRFLPFCLVFFLGLYAQAYTVGGASRPTFNTAPQGSVRPTTASSGDSRPSTQSSGSVRPTTQPGNSSGRFTEPTGPVRPTTPEGLSAQRFTEPTGPVRPGLDAAASGVQEAFSLAPKPSGAKTAAAAAQPVSSGPAEGAASGGIKAAKLGGGESGLGAMTAQQQAERESAAKNSEAAAALNKARDPKAMEQDAMAKIQGITDALGKSNSKVDQKVESARKNN